MGFTLILNNADSFDVHISDISTQRILSCLFVTPSGAGLTLGKGHRMLGGERLNQADELRDEYFSLVVDVAKLQRQTLNYK